MEIRELEPDELPILLYLYTHMHDRDDPLPEQKVLKNIWTSICEDPNHKVWGLFIDKEAGHQLVSSCVLCIIPNLTRGCRSYGLIENVVTHAEYRRQKYGNALIKHALDYAWQQNCYKVMLMTGRKDEGVYRFYEAAGFDRNAKQAFLAKDPGTK